MVKKADKSRRYVFFVGDESTVCAAVKETFEYSNIKVRSFVHPSECLDQLCSHPCDLLIIDLKTPGKSGMQLLQEVRKVAPEIPTLMIAGYSDIPTAVSAIKHGAVDFIEKPFDKSYFVQKVKGILAQRHTVALDGFRALTRMEMRVLRLILIGKSNSEIAAAINRSLRTVESHRGRLMGKLGVHNLVELFKVAATLGLVGLTMKPGAIRDALEVDKRSKGSLKTK